MSKKPWTEDPEEVMRILNQHPDKPKQVRNVAIRDITSGKPIPLPTPPKASEARRARIHRQGW